MSNIGYATLSVIPSMRGAQAILASEASDAAGGAGGVAGQVFGGRFTGALQAGTIAAGIGAVVVGGLAAVGSSFDQAFDTIRTRTGETGPALEALKDDFREVVSSIPTDFGTASEAVGQLNQRLGLTGQPLQDVSTRLLELSRITDTDLNANIRASSRLFGDWGVATGDQADTLDALFRASQSSGIAVDQLAQSATDFGSPLRQLGFGLDESLALFSRFEAEGVNTSTVMAGMRQAVKNLGNGFAEEQTGVSSFQDILAGVRDGTFDLTDAMTVFGARAGTDVFKAIQEGRFELDDYLATINGGSDTILDAADDTNDWRESLDLLRNNGFLLIEPVATRVFDALGSGAEGLVQAFDIFRSGGIEGLFGWLRQGFDDLSGPLQIVVSAVGGLAIAGTVAGAVAALAAAVSFLASPIIAIPLAIVAVGAALVWAYNRFDGFRNVVDGVVAWLVGTAWPALQRFGAAVGDFLTAGIRIAQGLWADFGDEIGGILGGYLALIGNTFRNTFETLRGIWEVFSGIFTGDWSKVWQGITRIARALWNQVVNIFRNGGRIIVNAGRIAFTLLGRAAQAAATAVINWFRSLPGRVVSALANLGNRLLAIGRAAITGLWNGHKAVFTSVRNWFTEIPGRILDAIPNPADILYDAGRAILRGLMDGIESMLGGLRDLLGNVTDLIPFEKGPLSVDRVLLEPAGRVIMEGLLTGMKTGWGDVSRFLNDTTGQIGNVDIAAPAVPTRATISAAGGPTVVLELHAGDRHLLEWLRHTVRVKGGGNVQVALGQ